MKHLLAMAAVTVAGTAATAGAGNASDQPWPAWIAAAVVSVLGFLMVRAIRQLDETVTRVTVQLQEAAKTVAVLESRHEDLARRVDTIEHGLHVRQQHGSGT